MNLGQQILLDGLVGVAHQFLISCCHSQIPNLLGQKCLELALPLAYLRPDTLAFLLHRLDFRLEILQIIGGNHLAEGVPAKADIIQYVLHQIIFFDEVGFSAVTPALGVVGGTDIIFPFAAAILPLNGRQTASAVLAEQAAAKGIRNLRAQPLAMAAAVIGAIALLLQFLHQRKGRPVDDGRMVIFKNTLFVLWDTLILAVNGISGALFQAEGADVEIIVQQILDHAV